MLFTTLPLDPYDDEEEEDRSGRRTTAIVIGMVVAFLILVPLVFLVVFSLGGDDEKTPTPRPAGRVQMVFDDPLNGDELLLGQELEVLVSVDDPVGVDTIELRVGGRVVDQLGGEDGVGEPPQFAFLWTPDRLGSRRIEVVETNLDGERSDPISITVVVVSGDETPTPTETETETPTPTPTVREDALPAIALDDTTVFEEPDTSSFLVGQLTTDDEVEVVGRTEDASWLEVTYPPGEETTAWVEASTLDVDGDVEQLPVTWEEGPREGALAGTATGNANVYEEPDTGSSLAGSLTAGDELEVVGRTEENDWLEIIFPPGGDATGWVEADFIDVDGDIAELPVTGETSGNLDLVPTGLRVEGPSNNVVLEITNRGDDVFPGGSITATVGGVTLALQLPEMAPDEAVDFPISNVHIYTSTEVTAVIDTGDAVEESDEDNNSITETLAPAVLADLSLDDIRLIGADNHVLLRIENLGDANIVGATIAIRISGPVRQFGKFTRTISIQPASSITIEIGEVALDREVELTVTIDVDGAIDESDEANNTLAKTVIPR